MIKNIFQKIPPKNNFFGNCSEQKLWPGRKNAIFFPQRRFPKYRYFFGVGRPKNGDESDAIIRISTREKEICIRIDSKKKNIFFWIFRNVNYAKVNFPSYS